MPGDSETMGPQYQLAGPRLQPSCLPPFIHIRLRLCPEIFRGRLLRLKLLGRRGARFKKALSESCFFIDSLTLASQDEASQGKTLSDRETTALKNPPAFLPVRPEGGREGGLRSPPSRRCFLVQKEARRLLHTRALSSQDRLLIFF